MKSIVLVLFLVLNNIVFAQVTQEWVSIYAVPSIDDNAWPAAMTTDNDGNVYVTGTFVNEFGRDYLTIKYNSAGVEQWAVRYDQLNVDYFQDPRSIAVDGSGNVYVTGVDNGKAGTIKYDTNGIEQWIVKYPTGSGSGSGITVKVDNNGNVYVMILAGGTVPNAIIKYNPDGVEQWSTSYSSATNTQFKDMVLDDSANVYVTGIYWGGSTSYNYITIKYNTNGSFQWASTYIGPSFGNDTPVDITVDDSANVYVTGTSPQAGTGNDFLTVKYSSSGETLWTARYDGLSGVDEAVGLEVDNSGNVYVTGQSYGQGGYSYATVKYNSSGTEQWVKRFLGEPKGIVVDAADNVFVTGRTWGPASSSSITTIKYNPNGVAEWVGRFDSTGVSLRVAAVKIVPDDNDNIYVAGILRTEPSWANQNIVTIKYSQGLKITSPIAGEKWIAGETDTIKWTGGQAGQFLNIKLSTDGGNNYSIIAAAISAESGYYVWEIPEDLLSRKCKILIEDASTPNINTVSGLFKIKAYELIRVSATGDYEPFQMLHHNWSFENGYGMWDSSYYQQFDYKNGIDPYTGQIYASDFTSWYVNAKPEDFPSWPIFVRVFGADRCYLGGGPNPVMLFRWAAAKGKYGGSCYGFAISSLLAFENKQNWINRFKVPDFIELYSVEPDTAVKRAINEVLTYQNGTEFFLKIAEGLTKNPNTTLEELKSALLNNEHDNMALIFQDIVLTPFPHILSHAVTPYKITNDPNDSIKYFIHIYDNNEPLLDDKKIVVNTSEDSWEYPDNVWGWDVGGDRGLFLSFPTFMHLVSPNRPSTGYQRDSGTDYVQVYTNSLGSTTITDGFGGSMIYEADDSTIVNTIEGAIPIIHTTGFHQPPIGYLLPPDGEYRTLVHKNKSTLSYLSAYSDTLILIAGHTNADSTQQDWFKYSGSSLTVINIDPFSKLSNFGGVIIEDSVNQKTFDLLDLNNAQNDSLQLEVYQHDKLKLVNFGVAKAYNIKLRLFTLLNISEFEHSLVPVGTNSTHFIEPNWDNLSTVVVLTDIGNNGTIDDTLYLNNTVDVKDEGSLISPKEYQLAQNYPNPFNPTTKISYSIPQRGIVTLKVYDILGNEVSTLVNEEQSAGNYEVDFNAARLSSGIYFYKLQTENFVETKKMILLK